MRRRDLLLGLGATLSPLAAGAQQPGRVYRIGLLSVIPRTSPLYRALIEGLGRLGFVRGKNLLVDERGSGLKPGEYAGHAAILVQQRVDLIQCGGPDAIRAAQRATTTIPIVGLTDDIIGEGLVQSFAHPGGNTTGISLLASELDGKRLQILLELLPNARRIAVLAASDTVTPAGLDALREQIRGRKVEIVVRIAQKPADIAPTLEALKTDGAAGVNVLASALLYFSRQTILQRAAALRLPAIYQWPEMAGEGEGGLIGYGPSIVKIYEDQLARMVASVLRGTKPADIPVENPTHFYLAVNLNTAKSLGLSVPQSVLAAADEVIE